MTRQLISTDLEGNLFSYPLFQGAKILTDLKAFSFKNKDDIDESGHSNTVCSILLIPQLHMIATAGLDRKIILWDLSKLLIKRIYSNHHKKAITVVEFNESLILLVSGGLD